MQGYIYFRMFSLYENFREAEIVLSREFWSWKFWSPGPKFSLENMVCLLKNWSGKKTLILGLFLKQENIKRTVNQ